MVGVPRHLAFRSFRLLDYPVVRLSGSRPSGEIVVGFAKERTITLLASSVASSSALSASSCTGRKAHDR